jgi:hypothetical protein
MHYATFGRKALNNIKDLVGCKTFRCNKNLQRAELAVKISAWKIQGKFCVD